jgi:hypothetical protein
LKKLDTLILEGPLYEVQSLSRLKKLPYLGYWSDSSDSNKVWSTHGLVNTLDTLLPNTKKEVWCFPSNQRVSLFNGTTKPIGEIVKGDTLLGYDFSRQCFVPNVVIAVSVHDESDYSFCHISTPGYMTAADTTFTGYPPAVVATVNHPVISTGGRAIPLGTIPGDAFVFYLYDHSLGEIQVGEKQFYSESTRVYNLVTEKKNYFVNGYLFADK